MPALPDLGLDYRWQPPDPDEGLPVTLLVVSSGDGGSQALALGESIAPGTAILALQVAEADDWHAVASSLAEFVAGANTTFDLGADELWGMGFGAGATAVAALAVDHPTVLDGLVVLSGRAPFRSTGGRILDAKKTFCATGTADATVSEADYEELVELLVTAGAEVQLHWYDCGHEVTEEARDEIHQFLLRWTSNPEVGEPEVGEPEVSGPGTE